VGRPVALYLLERVSSLWRRSYEQRRGRLWGPSNASATGKWHQGNAAALLTGSKEAFDRDILVQVWPMNANSAADESVPGPLFR
jgi:hypothetical protein